MRSVNPKISRYRGEGVFYGRSAVCAGAEGPRGHGSGCADVGAGVRDQGAGWQRHPVDDGRGAGGERKMDWFGPVSWLGRVVGLVALR